MSVPSAVEPRTGFLPGWLISLALHGLLLAGAAVGLRGCQGNGNRGEADVAWKTVGLVTRPDAAEPSEPSHLAAEAAAVDPAPTAEAPALPSSAPMDDSPPVPLGPGPDATTAVAGPTAAVPRFGPANTMTEPTASPAPPTAGLKAGETSFLDLRASGQSFMYVIDASGSMEKHGAMALAKAELKASLRALSGDQRFGILFFNDAPHPLRLPGPPADLYRASDIHKTLAGQAIDEARTEGGTRFLPALELALAQRPDVIFFLTDADRLGVTGGQLDDIRRWNVAGTRIHCIEFGLGDQLGRHSGLETLAARNHGAYQYRDVQRGRSP